MNDRITDAEDFLTIQEIAALLRIQVSAVRARLSHSDASLPPSVRVGGRRLFPRALYIKWRDSIQVACVVKPTLDKPLDPHSALLALGWQPGGLPNGSAPQAVARKSDMPAKNPTPSN